MELVSRARHASGLRARKRHQHSRRRLGKTLFDRKLREFSGARATEMVLVCKLLRSITHRQICVINVLKAVSSGKTHEDFVGSFIVAVGISPSAVLSNERGF